MTDQELAAEIERIEAEIRTIGDRSLVRVMEACRTGSNLLKGKDQGDPDTRATVDRAYLTTIKGIGDLARKRNTQH